MAARVDGGRDRGTVQAARSLTCAVKALGVRAEVKDLRLRPVAAGQLVDGGVVVHCGRSFYRRTTGQVSVGFTPSRAWTREAASLASSSMSGACARAMTS